MKFVVDQRTGNSYPYGYRLAEESSHDEIPKSSQTRRTLQSADNTLEAPDWIRNALDVSLVRSVEINDSEYVIF